MTNSSNDERAPRFGVDHKYLEIAARRAEELKGDVAQFRSIQDTAGATPDQKLAAVAAATAQILERIKRDIADETRLRPLRFGVDPDTLAEVRLKVHLKRVQDELRGEGGRGERELVRTRQIDPSPLRPRHGRTRDDDYDRGYER